MGCFWSFGWPVSSQARGQPSTFPGTGDGVGAELALCGHCEPQLDHQCVTSTALVTQTAHSTMWAATKNYSCIQARPSANVQNIWNVLTINSLQPFFSAVLVACSSKPQDKEIRKLNEILLIQYYIICLVYVLKHIGLLEMR